MTLTDESPMPWGKYKGTAMCNVPATYLIWIYDNDKIDKPVREYVEDNRELLDKETEQNNTKNK